MNDMQNSYMLTDPCGRLIRRFAVPGVVSMVVNSLYNIVDQIFIGHSVGYLGNAATNVILPLTVFALAVAIMLGDGGASFMSLNLGCRRRAVASSGVRGVVSMAIVAGMVLAVTAVLSLEPLCVLCGATDTVMPYALEYGRIICYGLPLVVVSTALNSLIRADGSPKFAMAAMVTGAAVNVILDALFIFGFGWGIAGAAWATVIAQTVTLLMSLWYMGRFTSVDVKRRSSDRVHWRLVGAACGLGMSSFFNQIAVTIVIVVGNGLITRYGALSEYGADIPLAAYGITMKVGQIVTSVILGIAVGCQPVIGYNYGAGRKDRVRLVFVTAAKICTLIAVAATVVFEAFPQRLVAVFGSGSALYDDFAVKSFRIFLGCTLLNGFQICASIYFQSIGHALKATLLSMSRQLIFLVPLSYLFCRLMGLEGVLWAGPVTDVAAFLLTLCYIAPEMKRLSAAS